MTKLIDADKLREQIRKLIPEFNGTDVSLGRWEAIDKVTAFIDEAPDLSQCMEEDEHHRSDAIYFLNDAKKHYADTSEIDSTINWLNSLHKTKDLSVKEDVDLEKEIDLDEEITKYWKDISSLYGAVGKEITRFDFDDACKYFYELGKKSK